MSYFEEVYDRIKFATNARTQVDLAHLLEIRQSSISDAKRRRSIPPEWYIKLYDKFGLSLDWLRWRTGPMYSKDKFPFIPENVSMDGIFAADLCENGAPARSLAQGGLTKVSGTAYDYVEDEGIPEFTARTHLVLPQSFLGEGMLVFYLEGSGMEPTLRKGAYVGVSSVLRNLSSGEVYALLMPHEGVIFRRIVQDSETGMFLLCFDQPGLPQTRMPVKTLQTRVLGKVIWTLQSI